MASSFSSSKLTLSSNFTPKILLKSPQTTTFLQNPSKPITLVFKTYSSASQNPQGSTKNPSPLISLLRAIPDWADEIKETRMQQKRTLYNHEDWLEHRSSLRHLRHLLSSLSSWVILSLIPPVIAFTWVATMVACYNSVVEEMHWLPSFMPVLRASSLSYQLTARALALLLVFRTEASYSRFKEGRKAWTKVIAGTNDFAGQVIVSVDSSRDGLLKNLLLQYIMAFPVALKESKISCFHEGISVCEQLIDTPIPLSYTRLTSQFLFLWHLHFPSFSGRIVTRL